MDGSQKRKPRRIDKQRGDRQRHLTAGYDGEINNTDREFREGGKSRRRNSNESKQEKSYNVNQQPAELHRDNLQEYVEKKKVKRIKSNTRQNSIGKIEEGIVVKDFGRTMKGDKSSEESGKSTESDNDTEYRRRSRESPSIIERPSVRPSDIWKEERVKRNNRSDLNQQTSKFYSHKSSRNGNPKDDFSDYSDSYEDDEFDSESDDQREDDFSPRRPKNITKRGLHFHDRNYPSDDELMPRRSPNRQKLTSLASDRQRGRPTSTRHSDAYSGRGLRTQGQLLGDLKDALFDRTTSGSLRNFDYRSVRDKRPKRTRRGGALRDSMSVDVPLHSNHLDVYDYHDDRYLGSGREMLPPSPRSTRSFNVKKSKDRQRMLSDEDNYRGQRNRDRERVSERVSDERIARERDRLEREFIRENGYMNQGRGSDITRERHSRQMIQRADHGTDYRRGDGRRQRYDGRRSDARRGGGNKKGDFEQEYIDDDELRDERRRGGAKNRGNFEQEYIDDDEMRGETRRGGANNRGNFEQEYIDDDELRDERGRGGANNRGNFEQEYIDDDELRGERRRGQKNMRNFDQEYIGNEEMIRMENKQPIEDYVWNSEYCDDPGMLDIPSLSPGYDDFCDILYDQSVTDMKINRIKSDSMNVNLSSENGAGELSFEEGNGLARPEDDRGREIADKGGCNDRQTEFGGWKDRRTEFDSTDHMKRNTNFNDDLYYDQEVININLPGQTFMESDESKKITRPNNSKDRQQFKSSHSNAIRERMEGKEGEMPVVKQTPVIVVSEMDGVTKKEKGVGEGVLPWQQGRENTGLVKDIEDDDHDYENVIKIAETIPNFSAVDKNTDSRSYVRRLESGIWSDSNETLRRLNSTDGQSKQKDKDQRTRELFLEMCRGENDNGLQVPGTGSGQIPRRKNAMAKTLSMFVESSNPGWHDDEVANYCDSENRPPLGPKEAWRGSKAFSVDWAGTDVYRMHNQSPHNQAYFQPFQIDYDIPEVTVKVQRPRRLQNIIIVGNSTPKKERTKGSKKRERKSKDLNNNRKERGRKRSSSRVRKHSTDEVKITKDRGSKDKAEQRKRTVKEDSSSKSQKVSSRRKESTGSRESRSEKEDIPKARKRSISSKGSRGEKGRAKESTSSKERNRKESASSKERNRKESASSKERNRKCSSSSDDRTVQYSTASKERKTSREERKRSREETKGFGSTYKESSPKRHVKKTETHSKSRQIEAVNRKEILRTVTEGSQEQSIELYQESGNNIGGKMNETRGKESSSSGIASKNTSDLKRKNETEEVVSDEERKKSLIGGLLRRKLDSKRKNEVATTRNDKQQQQHVQQQQQQRQQQQRAQHQQHQRQQQKQNEEAGTTKKLVNDKGRRQSSSGKENTQVKKSLDGARNEATKDNNEVISDEETKMKLLSNLIRKRQEAKGVKSAQGGAVGSSTDVKNAKSQMNPKVAKVTKADQTKEEVVSDEENKTKILSNLIRKRKEAKMRAAKLEELKADKDPENIKKVNEVKKTQKGTKEVVVSDEDKKTNLLSNLIRRKKRKEHEQNKNDLGKDETHDQETINRKEEKQRKGAKGKERQTDSDKVDGKGKRKASPREGNKESKISPRNQDKLSPREQSQASPRETKTSRREQDKVSPRENDKGKVTKEKRTETRVEADAKVEKRTTDKQQENTYNTVGKNLTETNKFEKCANQNTTQKNEINLSKSPASVIAVQNVNTSENNMEDFEKKKSLLGRLVKKKVEAKREAIEAKKAAEHKAKLEEDRQRALQKLRQRSYDSTDYESTDYDSSDYDSGEDESEESETESESEEDISQGDLRKKMESEGSEYVTDSGEESGETNSMMEDEGISEDGSLSEDGRDEDLRKNKMPVYDSNEEDEFSSQGESSSGEEESSEEETGSSEEEEATSEDELGSSEEGSFSGSEEDEGSSSEEEKGREKRDVRDHDTDVESGSESELEEEDIEESELEDESSEGEMEESSEEESVLSDGSEDTEEESNSENSE